MSQFPKFPSQWVIVTGGNRGVGLAITDMIVMCGFGAIVLHKTMGGGEAREQALIEYGSCDVAQTQHVKDFFDFVKSTKKNVVGIVHCAGVQKKGDSEDDFRIMFETNVFGPYLMTKAFASYRRECFPNDGIAAAIFIGSTSGLHGDTGSPLYAASKAGLHRLVSGSLTIYADVLRMNVIVCGPIADERVGMDSGALEFHKKNTPTGRLTTSNEVAQVVMFYIQSRDLNMHGSSLQLDGARTRPKP